MAGFMDFEEYETMLQCMEHSMGVAVNTSPKCYVEIAREKLLSSKCGYMKNQ
jgi:hypothetical protein